MEAAVRTRSNLVAGVLVLFALTNLYIWNMMPQPTEFDAWLYLSVFVSYFVFIPMMLRSKIPFEYKRAGSLGVVIAILATYAADYLGSLAYLLSSVAFLSAAGYILARTTGFGELR